MKLDLTRYAPPGFELQPERDVFWVGMVMSALYSLYRFFLVYGSLIYYIDGPKKRVMAVRGGVMPDFVELMDGVLLGFGIVAAVMIGFAVWHYAYHTQGSRSIYLMRRLPDRWELHRRCLTLPLAGIALCALAAFLLILLYYACYMLRTPEAYLTPGQWTKYWRDFL